MRSDSRPRCCCPSHHRPQSVTTVPRYSDGRVLNISYRKLVARGGAPPRPLERPPPWPIFIGSTIAPCLGRPCVDREAPQISIGRTLTAPRVLRATCIYYTRPSSANHQQNKPERTFFACQLATQREYQIDLRRLDHCGSARGAAAHRQRSKAAATPDISLNTNRKHGRAAERSRARNEARYLPAGAH